MNKMTNWRTNIQELKKKRQMKSCL